MKQIFKYEAQSDDTFEINMPSGAEILTCQVQYGMPRIWALVDPTAEYEKRTFRIAGTGHPINHDRMKYISTIQLRDGHLVFHLFEITG